MIFAEPQETFLRRAAGLRHPFGGVLAHAEGYCDGLDEVLGSAMAHQRGAPMEELPWGLWHQDESLGQQLNGDAPTAVADVSEPSAAGAAGRYRGAYWVGYRSGVCRGVYVLESEARRWRRTSFGRPLQLFTEGARADAVRDALRIATQCDLDGDAVRSRVHAEEELVAYWDSDVERSGRTNAMSAGRPNRYMDVLLRTLRQILRWIQNGDVALSPE